MKKNAKTAIILFVICFIISVGLAMLDYETVSILDVLLSWQNLLSVTFMAVATTIILLILIGIIKLFVKIIRKLKKRNNNNSK